MTGFRVSQHRTWRRTDKRQENPAQPRPAEPVDPPPPLHKQLMVVPARLHDKIFGRLERRRPLFLATRFILVLIAVMLILQGVSGNSQEEFSVGDYSRVTQPNSVQAYLAPGSTHKYPIDVAVGESDRVSAFFTQEKGVVRLPSMDHDRAAYGLQIGVQHDQRTMDVSLMVAQPKEGFRSVPSTYKDESTTQFDAVRFADAGEYGVLVRSTDGVGSARIMVSVVEAPLEADQTALDWLPLLSGGALATVLAGPYLPGAQKNRFDGPKGGAAQGGGEAKRPKPDPETALALGFAHLQTGGGEAHVKDGKGASAEELAAASSKRGWIIRIE